ncbi:DsrE family protein [Terricaulis sp.]|uniref:DsrE family protein n=1 Tax=Terricaulis sp. TaxID=2768686 RepID=UPI0037836E0E
MTSLKFAVFCAALLLAPVAYAEDSPFSAGPVINDYGRVADVEGAAPIPAYTRFKVVFDVSEGAEPGEVNRGIESAARFLNMHARAGVRPSNIRLAIVVRGSATRDLTIHPRPGEENANAALIAELIAHNVDIYVCGQSAAHFGVSAGDLLPNVRLALSAMTEHALLQQQGYTLNPS